MGLQILSHDDAFHSATETFSDPPQDTRFRRLLGDDQWRRLPPAVQHRFSKRLNRECTATYVGEVIRASFSRSGRLLAQLARLIGGPLPLSHDTGVPTMVAVTEDMATGGQIWTRV